jgi:hypothetical protein
MYYGVIIDQYYINKKRYNHRMKNDGKKFCQMDQYVF